MLRVTTCNRETFVSGDVEVCTGCGKKVFVQQSENRKVEEKVALQYDGETYPSEESRSQSNAHMK